MRSKVFGDVVTRKTVAFAADGSTLSQKKYQPQNGFF